MQDLAQSDQHLGTEIIMTRLITTTLLGIGLSYGATIAAEETFNSDELNLSAFDDFELPEFDEYSVPVVLTATRIQQHQSDVPASVTILDSDLIKRLGVKNLPELLRYVPGMMIGPDRNNNADSVHYHGGPAALPKNLQVLVNGRSMYRAGLAAVSWYELPVAMEDIRRVEVVRGPNSATYGANAYQAVINILTKHPSDTYGFSVVAEAGDNGDHYRYLKHGGRLADTDYRVSYTHKATDHFKDFTDDECVNPCRDDKFSQFLNLETHKQLASSSEIETSVVLHQSEKYMANPNDFQANDNLLEETRAEFALRFTKDLSSKHQIKVSTYLTQFHQRQAVDVENVPLGLLDEDLMALYLINPDAAEEFRATFTQPSSLDLNDPQQVSLSDALVARYANPLDAAVLINGTVNADLDETRFDVEIQDTLIYSSSLTLVSGLSFRKDVVDSDHYFNGELTNTTSRIFGSATWEAIEDVNLHLGIMGEKESQLDMVFAPRVAVNYKLAPSQSLRWVYSESVRSPDFFEQDAYWNFRVDNAQPSENLNGTTYYQIAQSDKELDHQKIVSRELGYYGRFNALDLELDVKYFVEEQTDVIYQSIRLEGIESVDDNSIEFEGMELQAQLAPWQDGLLRFVGAHIEAEVDSPSGEVEPQTLLRVHAKDQIVFSWFQDWHPKFSSSVSYAHYSKYGQMDEDVEDRTRLEQVDINLYSDLKVNGMDVELSLRGQKDLASKHIIDARNQYEDDSRIQIAARINF